jgi:hypothetical protein
VVKVGGTVKQARAFDRANRSNDLVNDFRSARFRKIWDTFDEFGHGTPHFLILEFQVVKAIIKVFIGLQSTNLKLHLRSPSIVNSSHVIDPL